MGLPGLLSGKKVKMRNWGLSTITFKIGGKTPLMVRTFKKTPKKLECVNQFTDRKEYQIACIHTTKFLLKEPFKFLRPPITSQNYGFLNGKFAQL